MNGKFRGRMGNEKEFPQIPGDNGKLTSQKLQITR